MRTDRIIQVASSFGSALIEPSLCPAVLAAGVADGIGFAQCAQMREYMLTPTLDTESILGTVVLLRVEDWLREKLPSCSESTPSGWARQELRASANEFVNQLAVLSLRGREIWFLACPSAGWLSKRHNLGDLCRTYTNLVMARVRTLHQVTVLTFPAVLSNGELLDPSTDELHQIPFTKEGFDQLGESVGAQIAHCLARKHSPSEPTSTASPELAAFLAGLSVQVRLAEAGRGDYSHVDRILRTAASFSLTGERPEIDDAEIHAFLDSKRCVLISVSDRLSEYGPSGVVVLRSSGDALVVESLSLSCTVLGKQVEYAVLSALTQIARERQCARVVFEYRPSARNQPILAFLRAVTEKESDTRYVLPVDIAEERINAAAVSPGAWSLTIA